MKRSFNIYIVFAALMSLFVVNALATPTVEQVQSKIDSLAEVKLIHEANDNFTDADSVGTLIEQAQRQLKAVKTLSVRQAKAERELHIKWNKAVTPMNDLDEVWEWCDSVDKAKWLSERYKVDLPAGMTSLNDMIEYMKTKIAERKQFRSIAASATSGVQNGLDTANGRIDKLVRVVSDHQKRLDTAQGERDQLRSDMEIIRQAVNNNGFDIDAALTVLSRTKVGDDQREDSLEAISEMKRSARSYKYNERVEPFEKDEASDNK